MTYPRFLAIVTAAVFLSTAMAAMPAANDGGATAAGADPKPPKTMGWDAPVATPIVGVRPLLVVLVDFTDIQHDPLLTPAFIRNQIFGPRPSVNDFYLETSYGQFAFSDLGNWGWITAYDDPGTSQDESTRAYWGSAPDPCCNGGTYFRWVLRSLDLAGFNFAPLDFNNDGTILFGPEVAYLIVDANTVGLFGGAMRVMPGGLALDGKAIEGVACAVSGGTPWITLYAHELAHQTSWLGGYHQLVDYYGIIPEIVGWFSLMGWSGAGSQPVGPHHLDPFSKLKLGWYSGAAVSGDGFFDIADAETNQVAYILHDPAHGTNEYFMIENRWKGTSYDNTDALIGPLPSPFHISGSALDIPDEGILIWHVDETRDWNGSNSGGFAKVDLIRRVPGNDLAAAFDGGESGSYHFWDGSAPENARWNDGTNSKAGVWCVGPRGATMRAYLDVAGPGVLICSPPLAKSAIPGSLASYTFPVTNTGDASDTFSVSATGLGGDVAVTFATTTLTLAAKSSITVAAFLEPVRACTTAPTLRSFAFRVQSLTDPAVLATLDATLQVLPFGEPAVAVAAVDGDVEPGSSATYSVDLTNGGNVFDTMSLSFAGVDFGTAYRAIPTAIPSSWTSFGPANPSAPACGATGSVLAIAVPITWAGMEDATYEFTVTATSGITADSDTASGTLVVRATPLSMLLYVQAECGMLADVVNALAASDVRDGLAAKVDAACATLQQAIDRFLLGDDPPTSNLLSAVQSILGAFQNQLDAQRDKAITDSQWSDLTDRAQQIFADVNEVLAVI